MPHGLNTVDEFAKFLNGDANRWWFSSNSIACDTIREIKAGAIRARERFINCAAVLAMIEKIVSVRAVQAELSV
jgi:hypothetical protein